MSNLVKVGVVGTSWWADLMHLSSLDSHPQAEISAICGRTEGPAHAMAQKYGIPKIYSDYRDLISDGALDAIVISTPDDTHYEIAMAALERGLHLLCEKPLANTLEHAEAMASVARESGVTNMTLFTWRWAPVISRLKYEIDNGSIGRPLAARLAFIGGGAFEPGYRWRSDATRCNGTLGDLGAHLIDLVHWCFGDIESVSAFATTQIDRKEQEPKPANDLAALDLITVNGVHASLYASNVALLGEDIMRIEVHVCGTEGTLDGQLVLFGGDAGSKLFLTKSEQCPKDLVFSETFDPNADHPDLIKVFRTDSAGPRAFIDAILVGQPAQPDIDDGLAVQRVITAALQSNENGHRIKL